MSTIKFKKDYMLDVIWGAAENTEIMINEITDTTRWSIFHFLVFKKGDKYYQTTYSKGATEQQDEQPWEYKDEVECTEVKPYEKTVIDYKPV